MQTLLTKRTLCNYMEVPHHQQPAIVFGYRFPQIHSWKLWIRAGMWRYGGRPGRLLLHAPPAAHTGQGP
jgi:hypothetical protein